MNPFQWIDFLADPVLVVNSDQDRVVAGNAPLLQLLKMHEQQFAAMACTKLFGDQRAKLITFSEEVIENRHAWSGDLFLTDSKGNTIEIEITASVYQHQPNLILLFVIRDKNKLRDLRERHELSRYHRGGLLEWRRVSELFRDMERENQLILHAVGEGIYGVDAEGRTTFVNPAAERMLGWHGAELMGRVIHRVVHHSHPDGSIFPLAECPIYAAFRDATIKRVGTDWFWRKDGSGFPVEYTSTPIMDNGHPVGAVVVFKDISQRKQSEQELREALAEVETLKQRLEQENAYLQEELSQEHYFHEIIGRSEAVKAVVHKIALVAPTDANVLIMGESGTGKELIARAIHQASGRRDRPLIRVNCAAIPKDLFESEFFGHIKGAFTGAISNRVGRFELADGGTLFLDEVGEIPIEQQGKLLRVLQEQQFERIGDAQTRSVDVRVIAATNRDLTEEIKEKRFREDLYFRLNVFPIESVPLRRRLEDIPLLAQEFLKRASQRFNRPMLTLRNIDVEALQAYQWPGNVRELENFIERQVITAKKHLDTHGMQQTTVTAALAEPNALAPANHQTEAPILTQQQLRELEADNIQRALNACNGKVFGTHGAAALLGMKPTTLASKLQKVVR